MDAGQWYLVVGYGGGAVAEVPCGSKEAAEAGRRYLMEAAREPITSGARPFVNVTDLASLTPYDMRFIVIEQRD